MRFPAAWQLKWLLPEDSSLQSRQFHLIKMCALVARNERGQIMGLTVFEPRDLSQTFVERFESRKKKESANNFSYSLYAPPFLKKRIESLSGFSAIANIIFTSFVHLEFIAGKVLLRDKMRVVNVDDSPVLLKFLKHHLLELGYIDIVAQVSNPLQAVDEIQRCHPDVVTMDIQMPQKNGVSVVRDLLEKKYYPIVMVSSLEMEEGSLVFEALNAGAFDYIQKPQLQDKDLFKEEISEKMLIAVSGQKKSLQSKKTLSANRERVNLSYRVNTVWCLGASTGGTQALTQVFTSLPAEIPPTFVVQHIPPVFSKAFAESLNKLCPFTVKEAENGEPVKKNHVYIAPGGWQMGIEKRAGALFISIIAASPQRQFNPSVDYLFSSVAGLEGLSVVAGVLTGMGKDGAQGLLDLKKKGAFTFAQDEQSSAVYGMPREALEMGGAQMVLPLHEMADVLIEKSIFADRLLTSQIKL